MGRYTPASRGQADYTDFRESHGFVSLRKDLTTKGHEVFYLLFLCVPSCSSWLSSSPRELTPVRGVL